MPFVYNSQQLHSIADSISGLNILPEHLENIPIDLKRGKRRRGCRAGARVKARKRKYKPYVPSVIYGNVRSLIGKIDGLRANCRFLHDFREACIVGLNETWLDETIDDSVIDITGFTTLRNDRTRESGKEKGGGIILYINDKWCNNITVKFQVCSPDAEILSVSLRPYYLPREFTNIYVTAIYIPPDANRTAATEAVTELVSKLSNEKPDALHILFGDANRCVENLKQNLHGFEQIADCTTRMDTLLDPFFCNISQSYKCHKLPPLLNSDHNMIKMTPTYRTKLKTVKPRTITKTSLTTESIENLNTCFDLTNWDLFVTDSNGDVNELTEVVTSYIHFCEDLHSIKSEIKIFPNNKPWVTSSLRKTLIKTHKSYGTDEYHNSVKLLKKQIWNAKMEYKEKVEHLFDTRNTKEAWRGLKILTGMEEKKRDPAIITTPGSAERLNIFYSRFDDKDFSKEQKKITEQSCFE